MGKHPALMAASIGALSTRVIFPTRPYLAWSRYSAVNTPVGIGRARVPSRSRAVVSLRFSWRNTRCLSACSELRRGREEAYSSDLKGLGVGNSDTILVVWYDTLGFEDLVSVDQLDRPVSGDHESSQLGSGTVENNRVKTEPVQERQG
jgi:hypothetical protein